MTDRELLELAAKAAGVKGVWQEWWDDLTESKSFGIAPNGACGREWWNPLKDGGESQRLAVACKLSVNYGADKTVVYGDMPNCDFVTDADHKRAIVRAAAEIGRAMP